MLNNWLYNIRKNIDLVKKNMGPSLVVVVSKTEADSLYWKEHFLNLRKDVFRRDGNTHIVSVYEGTTRGNFLGMLNAWAQTKQDLEKNRLELPDVGLMSMVFGLGTRLSPFTQTMGNRKPAFVTPMKSSSSDKFLSAADVSNLYANTWLNHFKDGGFRGLLLKWGDEAIIPDGIWKAKKNIYSNVDGIRLVWVTNITETLAREKEWIEIQPSTGLMTYQYRRQNENLLKQRVTELEKNKVCVGVNLGSFAISYKFLDAALEIFMDNVIDPRKSVSWDPYVWIALFCRDESQWETEIEIEKQTGLTGIKDLVTSFPDFYRKITLLRSKLGAENKRQFIIPTIDFGDLLHIDLGLHWSLKECLYSMTTDSDSGVATKELFGIHAPQDENGNIIINSSLPSSAKVRNSVIIDSEILDDTSIINHGVVIKGRHKKLLMPNGGIALFCAADFLEFKDKNGVAYRSFGHNIVIPEGGRHTSLLNHNTRIDLISNETITNYSGANYTQPILNNALSFYEAGEIMSQVESHELEERWFSIWKNWF